MRKKTNKRKTKKNEENTNGKTTITKLMAVREVIAKQHQVRAQDKERIKKSSGDKHKQAHCL